jgi:SpoVK/Ycf46/Vps4 family AAA+-type ATPase
MTTSLDSYLHGAYKDDNAFLRRLTNTIREVLPVFYKKSDTLPVRDLDLEVPTWPYAITGSKDNAPKPHFSSSTHCMILFALDSFNPRPKDAYSILLGKGFRPHGLLGKPVNVNELQAVILKAKKALVDVISRNNEAPLVKSGTYGNDDPFTLTWLTEIAHRWIKQSDVAYADWLKFNTKILEAVETILKRENSILNSVESTGFTEVKSSFLDVRRLHLALSAKHLAGKNSFAAKWLEDKTPDFWKNFDDTIHRQLSYSSMGDSKFNPAELALAFEGALLLHPTWVGRYTVDEVFGALKLSRDRHPYWRPITPFLANDKGHVLFMISIEVGNSILRACEILDEFDPRLSRFSKIEPQLRSYAMWLLGEKEEILDPNQESNFVGWRTEYEDKRDTIQLWHTSHVLLFLAHYGSLLKRKIAADGIDAAGLQVRMPETYDDYWLDEPLQNLAEKSQRYAVHKNILNGYIESRKDSNQALRAPRSIVLYGPPGTGKTTIAEQMAASLNRPLITVTVSDFLADAEIENRAKGVFEILRSQDEVVVLFDEIDQFLLDRNSKLYMDQDDVFKFMTPGMLTKLQDLRDAPGCIFIVATNYYERIDSAIKRPGRIDQRLLLCVPDQIQRRKLMERFVLDRFAGIRKIEKKVEEYKEQAGNEGPAFDFWQEVSTDRKRPAEKIFKNVNFEKAASEQKVLEKTALFGYGDIKNLVDKIPLRAGMNVDDLANMLAEAADPGDASVSLIAYRSRFNENSAAPFEEFFLLLYLVLESGRGLSRQDLQGIHHVLNQIEDFDRDNFETLKDYIQDTTIYETLSNQREKILENWES